MDKFKRQINNNLEIQMKLENFLINLISISYEPPRFPWHTKPHCHSSYELHFIPTGKGVLKVGDEIYQILPRTFYITGPGIYHEQTSCKKDPMTEYCMNIEFKTLKTDMKSCSIYQQEINEIFECLVNNKFWFGADNFEGASMCSKIVEEINNQLIGGYHTIKLLTQQVIILAGRLIANNATSVNVIPKKDLYSKRRLLLDDYFRIYNKATNASDAAKMLGVSTRHLNRIMFEYYSMSFKSKLTNTRLKYAKGLLISTNLRIKEIALQVNYTSEGYFCKVFKMYEKCTPTEFRNKR